MNIMETSALLKEYVDYVEKSQTRKVVLFGAGANAASLIVNHFIFNAVEFICDNDEKKHGKKMLGVSICSPEKLLDNPENFVVIITPKAPLLFKQIQEQCIAMKLPYVYDNYILSLITRVETYDSPWCNSFHSINFYQEICKNNDKIQSVRSILCDEKSSQIYDAFIFKMKYSLGDYSDICDSGEEYFLDDIFSYTDKEIFVDGGSYNGDDTIRYFKKLGSKFKRAYCFEPDDSNYSNTRDALATTFGDGKTVKLFKSGLSNKAGSMNFLALGTDGSRYVDEPGETKIVKLDDIVDKEDTITFIKLDIEGAELSALEGMKNIIQRDKPKLAICIYHKLADLWEIPLYIKELVPEYKIFVRHHWHGIFGKILYATT
ncbi:MAG: FkbM family methyltransferase [Fibromonadales bacterium]|nr:FkbM family methyltransferase [Fibromonadales bacterium]